MSVKEYKGGSDLSCGSIPAKYPRKPVLGYCRFHGNAQESKIASGYISAFRLKSIFKLVSLGDYGHHSLKLKKGTSRKSIAWKGNEICWYCCLTFPEVLVEVPWQHLTFRINKTNIFQQRHESSWILLNDHASSWIWWPPHLFQKRKIKLTVLLLRDHLDTNINFHRIHHRIQLRRVCFLVLIFHWYSSIDSEAFPIILTYHPKQNKCTNLPRPGFSHLQLRNIWRPSSQARDAQPQRFNDMSQPPMAPIGRRVFPKKNGEILISWLPRSIFEWNTPWPK